MKTKMKTLYILNVDNTIDIITNSSSELFILNGQNQKLVDEMIKSVYPDYKSEYEEVVALRDASIDQINTYVGWIESPYEWNSPRRSKEEQRLYDISKAEKHAAKYGMDPNEFFTNWENRLNGKYWFEHISEVGLKKIAQQLDPNGTIFLLFSIDDNPNYDYQEKLSDIAQRYHLG